MSFPSLFSVQGDEPSTQGLQLQLAFVKAAQTSAKNRSGKVNTLFLAKQR